MPTATVRQRRVAASDDRSGTPPNFELHGGGLLRPQRPKWNQKTDDTYMRALKAAGFAVEDIDFVMCTHLPLHEGGERK